MSGQRAAAEPYTTRFQTDVRAVDGREVWLEETYFYAESGGQPADRGTIGGVEVEDVRVENGDPVHVLAEEPSFRTGRQVLCSVDWSFRMYCMRAHTASHVLYGAGRRLLEDLGYGGFDIGERKVRVDLETDTEVDDGTLVDLERLINRAIWESRPVSWEEIPLAEAREREEIAFNDATEEEAFTGGRLRIVTVGGPDDNGDATSSEPWDVAACGGTHVRNTREIGSVSVLGRSNPGEGLARVEFAVGPRAIERAATEKRTTLAARAALETAIEDVPAELERVVEERDALAVEVGQLRRELIETQLTSADPIDRDGEEWLLKELEDVSADDASDVARERAGELADVVALVGSGDAPFVVVGSAGSRSAADVVDDLTDEFGGGGGGSDRFAQAGGLDATSEAVVDWLA
ncbi:alanyl-tRNA editing protein [Natrialbaceae archaeon AArc-T1-2]|uniref:alanyl-tRNA editing protein n=1 Tax=Natrialbaceae archaeon AArc-T1-2 TaxID=3053904 RepID=UPI00255ABD25|nr:alanine--tRNA ligase-related protein [Natrialbaceae archaeon AArc-T1-2]WIV66790.1 alanine--tRNA ligase-related protein [Natrialbaceae archaeon AArc-T1-2]